MVNIELQEINDSLQQKIHKIKYYRLALGVKSDIEDFIQNHYVSGLNMFKLNTFKFNATLILEKYNIKKFDFEYEYDKAYDIVKIIIDDEFILNIKFIPEKEYHI